MRSSARRSRSALALAMAAAVAFVGSAVLLAPGRAVAHLASGAGGADGRTGALLLAIVILLAVTGAILVALAAQDLLARPEPHPAVAPRAGRPRARR